MMYARPQHIRFQRLDDAEFRWYAGTTNLNQPVFYYVCKGRELFYDWDSMRCILEADRIKFGKPL